MPALTPNRILATERSSPRRPDEAYGYGFFVGPLAGRRALHHSGDNGGYKAFAAWLPDSDERLVLLTNQAEVDPVAITSVLDAV